jgi:hypothetical protein
VLLGDDWVYPHGPHEFAEAAAANRVLFEDFRAAHAFGPYDGLDLRQGSRRNLVLRDVPLQVVHADLLTRYRVSRLEDSQRLGPLLRLIQLHLIDHPDDPCTVFLMAEGQRRHRSYQDDQISYLFQGRQYANPGGQRVLTYPGDREVRGAEGITVQMSYLDLGEPDALIAENVPHIAVWVPAAMARDTVFQPQGVAGGAP